VGALDLRLVRDQLGLAERLHAVPLSATVRGVWFSMAPDYVKTLGRTEAMVWQTAVPHRRRMPFLSYSLREFLEEQATAAAIVNPNDPAEGIRLIWRQAATMYVSTPFGRSLVRLLKPNPLRFMTWLTNNHDHFCNYGQWRLVQHRPNYVTMEMENEYIWLESAHRGGAEGALLACGVTGTVEVERSGPYDGRLHIRWQPHQPS